MKKDDFKLNDTDYTALEIGDRGYILNKGASLYKEETFKEATEYYRLAATLGDPQACSNLGYCYLYGRGIEVNVSLAIAYFKIAARARCIDAIYKLGDIYGSNKWVKEDKELSTYYYTQAMRVLTKDQNSLYFSDKVRRYPSLCFALAREELPKGYLMTNLDEAYELLRTAKIGYKIELLNGSNMYEEKYKEVCNYLKDDMFDEIEKRFRAKYRVDESDEFIGED